MSSGHLLLSCAKRAATTKIDLFAYLWQLPCALCSLILMTLLIEGAYHAVRRPAFRQVGCIRESYSDRMHGAGGSKFARRHAGILLENRGEILRTGKTEYAGNF